MEPVDILVIDDRRSNLLALKHVLDRPDYNLVLAQSGEEGLNQVLRHDFAVILLDVAMPGMDGFETAQIIKQRERSRLVPIIFVTASVFDMEQVFRGYTRGAVDYLRKPVDAHQLRAKVEVFVELYRQKQRIQEQAQRLREAELREQQLLRERAEEALRESEAVYQLTFEEAPVGIGHVSTDGRWLKLNERLSQMLGAPASELIGRGIGELIDESGAREVQRALARLNAGEIEFYADEHSLASGSSWAVLRLVPAREASRNPMGYIVVADDITDRKRLELERAHLVQELRQGIRVRDEFLSIAAHELKTPVTPLRLQTTSVLRTVEKTGGLPEPEQLLRQLQAIDKAAVRLEALVDKLLDVSQMSVGRLVLQPETIDLAALAADALERLRVSERTHPVQLSLDAPEPVVGNWDRVRLEQVIMNLVQNAIRYGDGKPVKISVAAVEGNAVLTVSDQGPGIPPEQQQRIFERFERAAPVRHFGGFGLGLWIVRQLVEAHGGRVTLASPAGGGTRFTVSLPLAATGTPPPAEPPANEEISQ